ncbi:outer membrane beta-barrel protein [Silvibacterium dinghuense]|uniref:Outer membrane protein beta-barrel domain-containing protein n=1 Tax=Silvibacterium dinghuense TaxID=1560006 RepID=A0A4Q1SKW3_9BACT|nr:outer membrane beta-barrel protein [Silvibacterium dinghuense]RXS97950.1 hypothetical protein ESZ00_08880 [Silvibacterium dinghuense]GGH03272.1 hypothetical protein GCM10011586_19010 [Silvibacterium dinghuense]
MFRFFAPRTPLSAARLALFALAGAVMLVPAAKAQNILKNSSAAVSGFAQFTGTTTGDGITDRPTRSAGAQGAFRKSYHWWLGWEASYGYTRFAEYYTGQSYSYQHNMHEFGGSYLVQAPIGVLGFKPFALAGVSAVVFSPSLNGGQNVSWQGRTGVNFAGGIDKALLTDHFGIRVQYRGVFYKTPDFNETALTTGTSRLTSEPMAGVFLKF